METIKDSVIKHSDEILKYLLKYKESNPDFTFALRKKDSNRSEEERLKKGQ
jgi:hypothetical protein